MKVEIRGRSLLIADGEDRYEVFIHPEGGIIPRRGVYTSRQSAVEREAKAFLATHPEVGRALTAEEYCATTFAPDVAQVCRLLKVAGRASKSYDGTAIMAAVPRK